MRKIVLLFVIFITAVACRVSHADCIEECSEFTGEGLGAEYQSCMQKCTGARCPEGMAYIPPGAFIMGCSAGDDQCLSDEKPSKQVTINKGFCMDVTEVTKGAYKKLIGKNPAGYSSCGSDCPVEIVDWNSAKAYCQKAGKRLPTEAEWEYAARGGTSTRYYWGNSMDGAYCWYDGNSSDIAHPVKKKKPNAYGLYDMLGSVMEWVDDCGDAKWYSKMPTNDPLNISTGCEVRVLRGGTRALAAEYSRVSYRYWLNPNFMYGYLGFRCSQDLD